MAVKPEYRWIDYTVWGLSIFLVFCLVFESSMALPAPIGWLGRWHPIVLHFPIVLGLLIVFLGLTGRPVHRTLLAAAAISALITAISGFFLGTETMPKGNLLEWHQYLGSGTALLMALWYGLNEQGLGNHLGVKGLQVVLVGLILFTGHYGGMVTHGPDFLALPSDGIREPIPEDPLIYGDVVHRILDDHCVKCHNPNKQKGELLMTSVSELRVGGESGPAIIPGNPEQSELLVRLHLPFEDEEHMPPEGEAQLEEFQIRILERWIALGASDTVRLEQLPPAEPLVGLVRDMMQPDIGERWKTLPSIEDSVLRNLASDYVTIERLASSAEALKVNVYRPPTYEPDLVLGLKPIAGNIVELDLSGLPLGEEELGFVAACPNLEWLEIDQTPVTDKEMDTLRALSKLRLLKVFDTQIGDGSIDVFAGMDQLEQLYLWRTGFTSEGLGKLSRQKPDVLISTGVDDEIKSYFSSRDTIPKNESP